MLGVQHSSIKIYHFSQHICKQVLILQFDTNTQRKKLLIFEDYGLPGCGIIYLVDGNISFGRNVSIHHPNLTASHTSGSYNLAIHHCENLKCQFSVTVLIKSITGFYRRYSEMAGTVFAYKFKDGSLDVISYNDTISAYILRSFL